MKENGATAGMLDLIIQPAFTVEEGTIQLCNEAARKQFLEPGMSIKPMLATGQAEYGELSEGCLYLTLKIGNIPCEAAVRRMEGFDLFTLEQEADHSELQVMALAAQELRAPLSSVMTVADQLFPLADDGSDPDRTSQVSRINRGLFQMLRIISNMSDAYRYAQQSAPHLMVQNIRETVQEIFDKSAALLEHGGIRLCFTNLDRPVFTLVDSEKLERAVSNILSNAVKFSGPGSCIDAKFTRRGNMLCLSVTDGGCGIENAVHSSIHTRYLRQPGLEDPRFGLGLGMVFIRAAATVHGGTVLIDHPENCGTRITMTLALNQDVGSTLRTSSLHVDYAGERDHLLMELSDVLPLSLYEADQIN